MRKVLLIFLLLLSIVINTIGQTTKGNKAEDKRTFIGGIVTSPQLDGQIELRVSPYVIKKRSFLDSSLQRQSSKDGVFRFELDIKYPCYITLIFPADGASQTNRWLTDYLIEPGDNIRMRYIDGRFVFDGKGSEKFKCQYELSNILPKYEMSVATKGYSIMDSKRDTKNSLQADSVYKVRQRLVERYKNNLSLLAYERMKVDLEGDFLSESYSMSYLKMVSIKRSEGIKTFMEHYSDRLKRWDYSRFDQKQILESRSYCYALLLKTLVDIATSNYVPGDSTIRRPSLGQLYNGISKDWDAEVRNRVLIYAIISYYDGRNNEIIDSAIHNNTNAFFEEVLLDMKTRFSPKRMAYNFELRDVSGKNIRLSDFKGKVIVVDYWFTGCTFCRDLEIRMKEIRKKFLNDPRIVFVSINADKSESLWKASIKGGQYTDRTNINVTTGKEGSNHEVFKYYGYTSCPNFLVVNRDFEVVSFKDRPYNTESEQKFVRMFNRLL